MNKFVSVILGGTLAFSLVACGGNATSSSSTESAAPATSTAESSSTAETQYEEGKYELLFNMPCPDTEPYFRAYSAWAENVNKRTHGEVKIELYTSSQLGVEEDIIEQIRAGANVGQSTDTARLANYVPEVGVLNCPYFLEDADEINKFIQTDMAKGWVDQLATDFGIRPLAMNFVYGKRHFMTNDKVIKTPADLSGMLMRTPGAPVWVESISALGATPTALARSEIYSAVQTKVIDGLDELYISYYSEQLYEVLNTVNETGDILLVNIPVVSSQWFNSLPEEYQAIVEEEAIAAGKMASDEIANVEEPRIREELKAKGITIVPPEEIDIEAFKAAGDKAYEALGLVEVRAEAYKQLGKTE